MCQCLSYLEKQSFRLAGEAGGKRLPKQTAGQPERDAQEALRYGGVPARSSLLGRTGGSAHPPRQQGCDYYYYCSLGKGEKERFLYK